MGSVTMRVSPVTLVLLVSETGCNGNVIVEGERGRIGVAAYAPPQLLKRY